LTDWVQQNPPWMSVNWCSTMDVAIRMVNWIWAYHFFIGSPYFDQNKKISFFKSLYCHAQFISENLEYFGEFSDNHYLSNIVGLSLVGILFPEFKQAKTWKTFGLKELFQEIVNQFHEDGVNFERSINYHRLTLEMVITTLLLCKKNHISVPPAVWRRVEKMVEFVLYYTKPDGLGPQIGDTDNGRLQILGDTVVMDHRYLLSIGAVLFDRDDFKQGAGTFHEDALWLLGVEGWQQFEALKTPTAPVSSRAFTHGGFVFLRHQELYMAVACGANGRRGIGNHSHNDALSFELYAYDKTFIVDPGAYIYTAAHGAQRPITIP
jgi:Heparinase II/III N-terminus/Heparinase II/III-like protein